MLKTILTGYIESALTEAVYDKLEDGSFSGKIPSCVGVPGLLGKPSGV